MARYVFRLSILGPTALDGGRINAAVDDAFRRFGFAVEDAVITNVKGVAPPTQQTRTPTVTAPAPGEPPPSGAPEPIWGYWANVTPWGWIFVDDAPAAANVRTLTQASIAIEGTLPPTNTSGRTGSAQVSTAVFAAVNAAFRAQGFYNLTGAGREAGLVTASSGGSSYGVIFGLLAVGGVYWMSKRNRGGLGELGRGHSKHVTTMPDGSTKNAQGLTWLEWKRAAAAPSGIKQRRAWRAGQDPTDWRVDPTT